jgi:hypothetical protein
VRPHTRVTWRPILGHKMVLWGEAKVGSPRLDTSLRQPLGGRRCPSLPG